MRDSSYYSRFYKEHETTSRAFRVLSLGFNKCVAKLDYTGFLRRHPSNHRFTEKGRTLDTLVVVHIVNGHGTFRSEASGEMPVPTNSVFFVFPGVNHYYRYDDETGWDEEWMELDPEEVLPLLSAGVAASLAVASAGGEVRAVSYVKLRTAIEAAGGHVNFLNETP